MDDSLRRLLRSIALGLPLAVPGAGLVLVPTLLGCGTCHDVREDSSEVRVAEISSGGEQIITCESVCTERFGSAPVSCVLDSEAQASCTY